MYWFLGIVRGIHRFSEEIWDHRSGAMRDPIATFLALALCGTLFLSSCAVNRERVSPSHTTGTAGEELRQVWDMIDRGYYRMVVTAEQGSSVRVIRQVEAWWDTHADLLRVEERDGQGTPIWVMLKKGFTVWSIDVSHRQAQRLTLKQKGISSPVLLLHPYSVLWQKASLTSVQVLSVDPLRSSIWATVRVDEQIKTIGNKVLYTWKYPDRSIQVSAELQTNSLLPIQCKLTYPNGKRLTYTYTILPQSDISENVCRLPISPSTEVQNLDSPLDLEGRVTLLRPSVPDSVQEGPGQPDKFAGGYADWYSANPDTRRFVSLHELFAQTGICEASLPARWGEPHEISYVRETYPSGVPALEIARLTFRKGSAEEFRIEIQQLPAGYSEIADGIIAQSERLVTLGGQKVGIISPLAPYRPAWIATWYDTQRHQIVSLECGGSEGLLLNLVKEVLKESAGRDRADRR